MSSTINASTASGGGVITSADASGVLALQTGGTTAVTIDASQNVGLESATSYLSVSNGKSYFGYAPTLISGGASTDTGILTGGNILFGTNAGAGNYERLRIDSSGNVKLSSAGTAIQNSSGRPILNQTGSVLQVVTFTTNTNFSTASSTAADTQLTLNITLSSTSSKVLVMVHHADAGKAQFAINGSVRLVRDVTVVFNPSYTIGRDDTATTNFSGGFDFHYLDSPATSGVVTYKTQAWTGENTARFYLGLLSAQHSITLMEIAG